MNYDTKGNGNGAPLPGHSDAEIMRLARQANKAVFWRYLSILAVIGLGVVGYLAAHASHQAAEVSKTVQKNQIENCKAAISPGGSRYIQAQGIRQDIQRNQLVAINPAQVAASFGITTAQAEALLKDQRHDQLQQIHDLLDVNCATGRVTPARPQTATSPSPSAPQGATSIPQTQSQSQNSSPPAPNDAPQQSQPPAPQQPQPQAPPATTPDHGALKPVCNLAPPVCDSLGL